MKTKIKRGVLIIFAVIIFGTTIVTLSNPLRKSEEGIRNDMLMLTPIGTEMKDVIKVINKHQEWTIEWIDQEYGYGIDIAGDPSEDYEPEIGEKSMRISGEYGILFVKHTYVVVYFGFGKDSKLVDITVDKGMNV